MAASSDVDVVPALPKTRSGKILRKTMRGIADGRTSRCPRRSRTRRAHALRSVLRDDAGEARLGVRATAGGIAQRDATRGRRNGIE